MNHQSLYNEYILSNGSFESHMNAIGNGYLMARTCFLTSHRPSSDDGIFFFIRDTDSGTYWSPTPAPAFIHPDTFRMEVGSRSARIERRDENIETVLDILVPETGDFELRRITLTNRGETARRLEVTSSLDIILLFDRLRDSQHQTFSNMFIGAEFSQEWRALLYHRRFFDNPEQFPIFMHRIFVAHPEDFLGFETDREAFIGRGQLFGRPLALDRPLRNTSGYILDPLANLRASIALAPGESAAVFFSNSAHFAPEQPERFSKQFPDTDSVRTFFDSEFENNRASRRHISLDIDALTPVLRYAVPRTETDIFDSSRLLFWNDFGGFDPDTDDYCMRIRPDDLPPQPWANILANPTFGTMTTENALGTTWFKNSKHGRLSPWSNNPVSDPPAEILFLRRTDTDETWSLTPSPLPASSEYRVTHGRGFTKYEGGRGALRHTLTVSVDPEHPIKYLAIEIQNGEEKSADIDLTFFMDAPHEEAPDNSIHSRFSRFFPEENALLLDSSSFSSDHGEESVLFHAAITADTPIRPASFSKYQLFGVSGILSVPKKIPDSDAPSEPLFPEDACVAVHSKLSLAPGETKRITFATTAETTEESVRKLLSRIHESLRSGDAFSLEHVHRFWKQDGKTPRIETPDASLMILFNTWLPYQTLVSRMWGKIGFYQPGGAFGFRDQLQDSIALLYRDPEIARTHILSAAREQFEDGNVRAWWSPDSSFGVRSVASDHPLWLAWITAEYIRLSGDTKILDETMPFLVSSPDDPTRFGVKKAEQTTFSATLLEHCVRAIEYASLFGAHGLPLIREGDWNDGFNRVGITGAGESVWLGFFLYTVLARYVEILKGRGNITLSDTYQEWAHRLRKNLNEEGWDGHWFLRAFYDDGTPLGSERNHECRIDAIAQSWSVLSGAGERDKSQEAMDNLVRFLYDPESKILKLLDPPFNDLSKKNPGYIKDYPPGIRENGSQYNHAVFWAAEACARLGNADMVHALLECANPIHRSDSEGKARLYEVEPYVIAADIYSAEHRGKGGWTWYTASAGLMYRMIIETLFGVRIEGERVSFQPSLPKDWTACSLTLPWKSGTYTFAFLAPENHANTIKQVALDGVVLENGAQPHQLPEDGQTHRFEISLE